jgi:hypothetical protein
VATESGERRLAEFYRAEVTKLAAHYDWPRCALDESRHWTQRHFGASAAGAALSNADQTAECRAIRN